jgi:hypothetical protein
MFVMRKGDSRPAGSGFRGAFIKPKERAGSTSAGDECTFISKNDKNDDAFVKTDRTLSSSGKIQRESGGFAGRAGIGCRFSRSISRGKNCLLQKFLRLRAAQ